jgi:outer membrane lipoprotein-sorting protein
MRPTDKIERYIKNTKIKTNPEVNRAVLDDLLDHLETAQTPQIAAPQPNIWRIIMENKTFRISTAAAVLLIAVLLGISQLVFVTPTFAQIVEPILKAKTIVFDMTVGPEDDGIVMHDRVKGSRIRRTISNLPNQVMIIDTENSKMLVLNEDKGGVKTATYIDTKGPLEEGQRNFLAFIREVIIKVKDNPGFKPTPLGKQEIDGRKVIGYAADSNTEHVKVWADAETALPVRVELGVGQEAYVIKNFEFDTPISDAEVSMDIPEGYTVKQSSFDFSNVTEANLIGSLRVWATVLLDNHFPDELSTPAYMAQVPNLEKKIGALDIPENEMEQMGVNFIQGMLFLQTFELHNKGPWHYAGKGVKFGDANTPVFWYRPEGSKTYRVIYGDLSVKDVAPENLPK